VIGMSARPRPLKKTERQEIVAWWANRFGVPREIFEPYDFFSTGKRTIWALRRSEKAPGGLKELKYEALGMVIMRKGKLGWKPTTNAIQVFGRHAKKNVVELNEAQMRAFVAGEAIKEAFPDLEEGYVITCYKGVPLGCGLYKRGVLRSQVPKVRRRIELI